MEQAWPTQLRERQKIERRRALIEAARLLFARNGYDQTSIESIADEANVSPATFYNYFGTKSAALLEMIAQADEKTLARLRQSIRSSNKPTHRDLSDLLILMVEASLETVDPETWRHAIAMTVLDVKNNVGWGYIRLNVNLYDTVDELLEQLVECSNLPASTDISLLRGLLQRLNHALFGELVSEGGLGLVQYKRLIRSYVKAVVR